MQTKLDQPPWKNGQHQTPETHPQLQTSRKKRSWTPQETMATRRCRNKSNDLIHGGRWWWWYTLCSYVWKLNKWKHLLFMTFLKSPDSLTHPVYICGNSLMHLCISVAIPTQCTCDQPCDRRCQQHAPLEVQEWVHAFLATPNCYWRGCTLPADCSSLEANLTAL